MEQNQLNYKEYKEYNMKFKVLTVDENSYRNF